MNIDELADLIVARLNPQTKNAAHRDTHGNAHLYPRRDMVWCSVCSGNHPSNECQRLRARPPALWCGHCNRWGNHDTPQCRYPRMLPPTQTQTYQPRPQQLALPASPLQSNQYMQGANSARPMPYQTQNVPLPPPILGPQPPPPRITPINQVMVEELSQGWTEPNPQITETYAEQSITTYEDDEYMSYLSHYVVQGDQHIPVYQTAPVNAKARDMNNTSTRPPIQCYKCSGPHKANECPHKA